MEKGLLGSKHEFGEWGKARNFSSDYGNLKQERKPRAVSSSSYFFFFPSAAPRFVLFCLWPSADLGRSPAPTRSRASKPQILLRRAAARRGPRPPMAAGPGLSARWGEGRAAWGPAPPPRPSSGAAGGNVTGAAWPKFRSRWGRAEPFGEGPAAARRPPCASTPGCCPGLAAFVVSGGFAALPLP